MCDEDELFCSSFGFLLFIIGFFFFVFADFSWTRVQFQVFDSAIAFRSASPPPEFPILFRLIPAAAWYGFRVAHLLQG